MFIHLGGDTLVSTKSIIIIINNENNCKKININEYLKKVQEKNKIKKLEGDNYKSIIITDKIVYVSPISSTTLKKRAEYIDSLA